MFNLSVQNKVLTMSSLEIANLTGKRHDNVLADIRKMLAEIQSPEKLGDYQDGLGRTYPMLLLDKEEALCLVSGYNIKMRMTIIRRWQQLEMENRPQLPNFNNPAEAARAWADQVEANQVAQQRLVEVAPKVEFVDRYVKGNGLMTFRQVCKLLNVKENEFRAFLISQKIMYHLNGGWAAYQVHLSAGRFQHKAGIAENGRSFSNLLFTSKGVNWVAEQWNAFNNQEEIA